MGPYGEAQEQPFAAVLQNRCPETFRNIHRKTPVLEPFLINESLFNKHKCFPVNIAKFLRTAFSFSLNETL